MEETRFEYNDNRSRSLSNVTLASAAGKDFTGAVFSQASHRSDIENRVAFYQRNLENTILINAEMPWIFATEANFSGADLTGANLINAELNRARFRGANLSGVNLRKANLQSSDLTGANLSGADLGGAKLVCTDLSDTILHGVDFRGASIYNKVIFNNADLSGAKFAESTLYRIQNESEGVGFKGAKNLAEIKVFGDDGTELTGWRFNNRGTYVGSDATLSQKAIAFGEDNGKLMMGVGAGVVGVGAALLAKSKSTEKSLKDQASAEGRDLSFREKVGIKARKAGSWATMVTGTAIAAKSGLNEIKR